MLRDITTGSLATRQLVKLAKPRYEIEQEMLKRK